VSERKKGDKVWVQCEVVTVYKDRDFPYVDVEHDGTVFQAIKKQCRPVEPEAIEACTETANDQLRQSLMDYPFGEPSNNPETPDSSSEPMRAANEPPVKEPSSKKYREPTLADLANGPIACEVRDYYDEPWKSGFLVCVHNSRAWRFQAQPQTRNYVYAPHWNQCRIAVPVEPIPEPAIKESLTTESNDPEIPDGSSESFQVGDAVRFVLPGHDRHGAEGIILSIVRGPGREYHFGSDCGQFHRYCTIAELEHYEKAETVDIKGSMQSLDGADTIQAGDLQWTDRDGKYRLCNFTIGMRVHEAIQRGKSHGEKWVFYRKFKEAGE
jgi:hypothetical protein